MTEGGEEIDEERYLTPIEAIRLKCLDCMCGSSHEVKLCPCKDCSLYRFRFGHNPNIKRGKGASNLPGNGVADGDSGEEE